MLLIIINFTKLAVTVSARNMPWAECRLLFLSLRDSLLPPLSPSATATILRLRLDKGSSLTSSNYRGCRSGVCVKRLRASKKFLPISLLNARSVVSKPDVIHHHLLTFDLDVLAITETSLTPEHEDEILANTIPEGYVGIHVPRVGRRGGGIAVIHRSTIRVNRLPIVFESPFFEHLAISLTVNTVFVKIAIIYRPPSVSCPKFLSDFSDYLEILSVGAGKLLILGDFNIHVDDNACSIGRKFLATLDSFGLCQHVSTPTHVSGRLLDLVLSRLADNFVMHCYTSDLISDHFAVHTLVKVHRLVRPQKTVVFRRLKSIDREAFVSDLLASSIFIDPENDTASLLAQYNTDVRAVLDKHAPLITKRLTVRPDNPWECEEICTCRRSLRRWERKYRARGLTIDRECLTNAREALKKLIFEKKSSFITQKITESAGKRSLFKLVDSFLLKKPALRLPDHDSLSSLVERFSVYFDTKISTIRSVLDSTDSFPSLDESVNLKFDFSLFRPITICETVALIMSCPAKSSPLDPLPTSLLKEFVDVLAIPITTIINLSLSSGVFPKGMKIAFITPLLKKPSLCPDDLSNYRPVSNLSFLSKLVERVAVKQLTAHLNFFDLFAPVQSAYRRHHSPETALLRVVNDMRMAVDAGDAVLLSLLDQSAAFDTIDHSTLLNRLSVRYGVTGVALSWFSSYLSDRCQSVSLRGVSSTPKPLRYGVPQGSVLGPILYILYTAPVCDIANQHDVPVHFYADDTQHMVRFVLNSDGSSQKVAFAALSRCIA